MSDVFLSLCPKQQLNSFIVIQIVAVFFGHPVIPKNKLHTDIQIEWSNIIFYAEETPAFHEDWSTFTKCSAGIDIAHFSTIGWIMEDGNISNKNSGHIQI